MNINELIATVKKKLQSNIKTQNIKVEGNGQRQLSKKEYVMYFHTTWFCLLKDEYQAT